MLLIDNYDSFVYNLYHYFLIILKKLSITEYGELQVTRNDKITIDEIYKLNPKFIVISPGPSNPNNSGISLDIVKEFKGKIPIFGICLGHQVIGQAFGAKIIKNAKPMHGKISYISHNKKNIFQNIKDRIKIARYHSLIIDKKSLEDSDLIIDATSEDDNVIMAISHKKYKIYGLQFHPESIASEYGLTMIENFIKLIK